MDVARILRILQRSLQNRRKCSFSKRFSSNAVAEESGECSHTAYVPVSNPATGEDVEKLQEFVDRSSRIFVLTGAGISTESGIPDYRSKDVGLYDRVNHRPMQHQEFISSDAGRQRYWARNYIGWLQFQNHRPNKVHRSLAGWERRGKAYWTVTQNVDALHAVAGTESLTELHGCLNRVICLDCGEISPRSELQTRLDDLNEGWSAMSYGTGPDADAFLAEEDVKKFNIAPCRSCGGRLKPDVVFFGDTVRRIKVERAYSILSSCDSMLVLGSSLYVWSGYRFVVRAHELGIPVGCVNIGQTRADDKFLLKINAKCGEVVPKIALWQFLNFSREFHPQNELMQKHRLHLKWVFDGQRPLTRRGHSLAFWNCVILTIMDIPTISSFMVNR